VFCSLIRRQDMKLKSANWGLLMLLHLDHRRRCMKDQRKVLHLEFLCRIMGILVLLNRLLSVSDAWPLSWIMVGFSFYICLFILIDCFSATWIISVGFTVLCPGTRTWRKLVWGMSFFPMLINFGAPMLEKLRMMHDWTC
jgi:hypothetical protein